MLVEKFTVHHHDTTMDTAIDTYNNGQSCRII